MRMHLFTLAVLGGMLPAGLALGQVGAGAASLRCSALADIAEDQRAAAIYYLAGYNDGERAGMSVGAASTGIGAAGDATGGQAVAPASPASGGPPAAILPVVGVEAILETCAQSPDSRIVDIITAQGARNNG